MYISVYMIGWGRKLEGDKAVGEAVLAAVQGGKGKGGCGCEAVRGRGLAATRDHRYPRSHWEPWDPFRASYSPATLAHPRSISYPTSARQKSKPLAQRNDVIDIPAAAKHHPCHALS